MKAMNHFYSNPSTDIQIESKPWADLKFITDDGEDLPEEEKNMILKLVLVKILILTINLWISIIQNIKKFGRELNK